MKKPRTPKEYEAEIANLHAVIAEWSNAFEKQREAMVLELRCHARAARDRDNREARTREYIGILTTTIEAQQARIKRLLVTNRKLRQKGTR